MRNSSQSAPRTTIRLLSAWAMVLMLLVVGAGTAYGGPQTASTNTQELNFGPFACNGCPSRVFTHHFLAEPGLYQMMVWAEGVGQAKIILNGQVVFGPDFFPDHPVVMGAIGPLNSHNTLKIKVWDNSYTCKVWVSFRPVPQTPPPQPPVPPVPTPPPTPEPCDPCQPPAPQPEPCDPCQPPAPRPEPCNPCQPPAPQPEPCDPCQPPAPRPEPCDPCQPPAPRPDPCGSGCGPSNTINQVNVGNGDNRDNVAVVDNDWGFYPYGRTTVNQVNAGDGNQRDNIVDLRNNGGAGSSTIVNQLNLGNGNDRGNIFEGTTSGGCGPGGCTKINQVNLGDGNNRFNLASMLVQW